MKIHFLHKYLLDPTHPITVLVIGCGGTGSHVLDNLAAIHHCLQALGKPGIHVTAFDSDTVSETNVGRQYFTPCDIGINKAVCLITRLNRLYGTAWDAVPEYYSEESAISGNFTLTCTDTIRSRLELASIFKNRGTVQNRYSEPYKKSHYWMDFGNAQQTGQVVLGSIGEIEQPQSQQFETISRLPLLSERFDLTGITEDDSTPSCSQEEALFKQDLFINSTLAKLGCDLLWQLLRDGMTDKAGLYLNLQTMNLKPMLV